MISIPIDPHSNVPMYEQIYYFLKSEIIHGALASGDKLPSTRSLANYLQVSRNTIDMAYGQLLSEGYIDSYPKRGYFINELSGLKISSPLPDTNPKTVLTNEKETYNYDFSPFSIDLKHFPYTIWQKLMKSCLYDNQEIFLLGENQGDLEFRKSIQAYIHRSRGVNCSPDQIIIGAGADYLLQLLAQLFNKKEVIAMEDPAYKQAYQIFEKLDLQIAAIPIDPHGIQIDLLRSSNANIAYVTPSHQFPLGVVMPIQRRIALLEWAKEHDAHYIIEDDHDSEFRYRGKPIPSLQGIDRDEKVIYMGTFSRSIAPAIRIGYMVLPKPLLIKFQTLLSHYSCTVSRLDQKLLTSFINEGYFERHLNRMRKHYKAKHDLLLSELRSLQSIITIHGEHAGLHLVVEILTKKSEDELLFAMKKEKLKLYPLSVHYIKKPKEYTPTFLIGYANMSEEEIKKGIEKLRHILKKDATI